MDLVLIVYIPLAHDSRNAPMTWHTYSFFFFYSWTGPLFHPFARTFYMHHTLLNHILDLSPSLSFSSPFFALGMSIFSR